MLYERDEELARLAAAVEALVAGRSGGVLLVEGPAGIGKSALLDAALERASGAAVLRARGTELEGSLSFGAVRDLLAPPLMALAPGEREALFAGPAGLARPVLGFPSDGTEGDPLYGLFWLVAGLAERTPLLLAVDDAHWLDEESSRFLAYLARRLEGLPVLLLATARPEPRVPIAEHAAVVRPAPLSPDGIALLVPGRVAGEVHAATGGNPLLAVELARADPEVPVTAVAPRSIARSVLQRVARVSEDAVALSRAVALSPSPLVLADAAALAGLELPEAAAAADALVRADVLRLSGAGLEFLHPVMRTAVYDELDPFARRIAHARAATVLAQRGADIEEIAAHLLAGEPVADPANVRVLRAAADRALARVAPRAAVRYLERALAEPVPPGQDRVNLRFDLGRLHVSLGRTAEAEAALRAALDEATVPEQRAEIALELAEALVTGERYGQAVALLEQLGRSAELAPEQELLARALRFDAEVEGGVPITRARRHLDGIPADLPGTTRAQRTALLACAVASFLTGEPVERSIHLLERSLGDPERGGDPLSLLDQIRQMRLVSGMGDMARAEALAEDLLARVRETGLEGGFAAAQLQLAVFANQRGDLRGCEATIRLALDHPGLQPAIRTDLEDWLITTLSMQGRFEEAEALLASLTGREPSFATAVLERRRGELALDRGDFAAALEPFRRLYESETTNLPFGPGLKADLATALAALGRREEAVEIAGVALEQARVARDVQMVGCAHAALGVALGGEDGLRHLREAVAVLRETPYRWNLANAEVALGAALRRANQRAEAREHLASALEYAAANGAAPVEARAREELRLCGARPRRVMRTGVDALTPSEERIARLAARGMTNKEIAQHLFVTVKNVEMHLVGAYRKLDVKSRRELPERLSPGS